MRSNWFIFLLALLLKFSLFANSHLPSIRNVEDIAHIFPTSANQFQSRNEKVFKNCESSLKELRTLVQKQASLKKVLSKLDETLSILHVQTCLAEALSLVSPNDELRNYATDSRVELTNRYNNIFASEKKLYHFLKKGSQTASLNEVDTNFLNEILYVFESNGQNLSANQQQELQQLKKEIIELEQAFGKNIQEDKSYITFSKEELAGIKEGAFEHLKQDEAGNYQVHCSAYLYQMIMGSCHLENTRKRLSQAYENRAFPNNETILIEMIKKRNQLAKLLGYPSYAHYIMSQQMCKDPHQAFSFLNEVWNKALTKSAAEFETLASHLPENIELTDDGKMKKWDLLYTSNLYKEKVFDINRDQIAEYFPFESTITGLMDIYQQFFDILITETAPCALWHEDVKTFKITEKNGQLLGYILLDLFPRENKYSHACCVPLIPGVVANNKKEPALNIVVANFTKPTQYQPSLLKYDEVNTFFHEFGHAIHDLMTQNELLYYGNISNVKIDYVELPSQLLENWLLDAQILKGLSNHYQTHEPLPDSQIHKLIDSKKAFSGFQVQTQCFYSLLALNYFNNQSEGDPTQTMHDLYSKYCPHYENLNNSHWQLSFGHLTGYGPLYYGYLWSKVFAEDVFAHIKKEGLLNAEVGKRYRNEILRWGGAKDPNILIKNFLGREPNSEAFISSLELSSN